VSISTDEAADYRIQRTDLGEVEIAWYEWGHPRPDRPTVLFVHATGFHGRVWRHLIEQLGDVHAIAVDQRGHGGSTSVEIDTWARFGDDLAALVRTLGLADAIGVGHSMGGHALTEAAAATGAFRQLLLLDPTIAAPEDYEVGEDYARRFAGGHPASKRRADFDSAEDMLGRIRGKAAFPRFEPAMLQDYCTFGVRSRAEEGVTLACRPVVEASVYATARGNARVHESVARLGVPVHVIRAQTMPTDGSVGIAGAFAYSPTWGGLAGAFPRGTDEHWPDCTHFIPMERPDVIAERVLRMVAGGTPAPE
jgi:pimeloyl-ACP methyl ester carboxylesterase